MSKNTKKMAAMVEQHNLKLLKEKVNTLLENEQYKHTLKDNLTFSFEKPQDLMASDIFSLLLKPASSLKKIDGHKNSVNSVAFSPDSKSIVTGSWDNTVRTWSIATKQQVQTLNGHSNYVYSVAWSPNGDVIASGSRDQSVILWDATSGLLKKKLTDHTGYVSSVSFSQNGNKLASGGYDNNAIIWDVNSVAVLVKMHSKAVLSVCFSHDDQFVVTGCADKIVRMFNANTGHEEKRFEGHTKEVRSVAISFDGSMIASGSHDKSVRLWDVASTKQLQKLDGHTNKVRSVAFSHDGKFIASGSWDRTVRLWNAPSLFQIPQPKEEEEEEKSQKRQRSTTNLFFFAYLCWCNNSNKNLIATNNQKNYCVTTCWSTLIICEFVTPRGSMASYEQPAVGIDIGTDYCCVAWVKDGKAETIPNEDGERSTPSYIAFTNEELVAGTAAKAQVLRNRNNTVVEFKQMLGRTFEELQGHKKRWPFNLIEKDGQPLVEVEYKDQTVNFTPEELTGFMIQRMRETAEAFIGRPVREAVLTVPAHFTTKQRQALRQAASKAKLKVLRLINEPVAAALAANAGQSLEEDRTIVVIDFGSSVSISVLKSFGGIYQLVKHHVEHAAGGREFDEKLVGHFAGEFKRKTKLDVNENAKALTKLRLAAEQTKRTLSQSIQSPISVESLQDGEDLRSTINRTLFESLTNPLITKVLAAIEATLAEAQITKNDIHQVLLTGGSASMTKVTATLSAYFEGIEVKKDVFPEESAAAGAAIEAALLIDDEDIDENDLVTEVETLPQSISIADAQGKAVFLLRQGAPLPAKRSKVFSLGADQKAVQITVYAGDKEVASENTVVAKLALTEATPKGQVEVTASVDNKGETKVSLLDKTTGKATRAIIPVA